MTLSRKRASGASLPTSSLSKKLKLTSICPSQPPNQSILPINFTALLEQNPSDLMPDLQMQCQNVSDYAKDEQGYPTT
ncbi:uncharacterized protein FPRN_15177 [Fusarium proliferatum]|nr:uncharacterized protein FPRN_15177 [Fusarium proliferatum]